MPNLVKWLSFWGSFSQGWAKYATRLSTLVIYSWKPVRKSSWRYAEHTDTDNESANQHGLQRQWQHHWLFPCTCALQDLARGRKENGSTVSPSAETWEAQTPWEVPAKGTAWRLVSQPNFRINTSKGSENAVTSPRDFNARIFFHSKKQPNKANIYWRKKIVVNLQMPLPYPGLPR